MNENEYCIGEILPWVRKILTGTETTVHRECLQDYRRLAEQINKYVPVKHGHWIIIIPQNQGYRAKCSVCNCAVQAPFPYCPGCGAKMDATDKNVGYKT